MATRGFEELKADEDQEDEIQVLGRADIGAWTDQQIREAHLRLNKHRDITRGVE